MSERRDPAFAETLSFRLLTAANRLVAPFAARHGRPNGLALTDWRCMMALAAWPGSSGEDVARAMAMDRMGVSRALRRLEADGRARREDAGGRRNAWRLTDAGWTLYDRIAADARARDADAFADLSPDERAVLARALAGVLADGR